ncbi:MAG: hypothetical protein IPJ75_17010 [Ignavibacteriales bacterium]|nr:hypothetical protein [Ignavibacteriales bacterium]
MKNLFYKISLFTLLLSLGVTNAQALTGDYYIPQGANPKGFASFKVACDKTGTVLTVPVT